MSEVVQNILNRLDDVREQGGGYMALCPAHEDTNPSLSIREGKNGKVLLKCHAGCTIDSICKTLNIEKSDLFATRSVGALGEIVATYDYTTSNGKLSYQAVRYENKEFRLRRPDGAGDWKWSLKGVDRVLYRLPELTAAPAVERILICEGEKDCDNVAALGFIATTNAQGAGKWKTLSDDSVLNGHPITIIADKDEAGRKHARDVAKRIEDRVAEVRILEMPGDGKDVSDWIHSGGTKEELLKLIENAPIFDPKTEESNDKTDNDAETVMPNKSQASLLVQLCAEVDLFHDDEDGFASIVINKSIETFPIRSRKFRRWLGKQFYDKHGKAASNKAIIDAINIIEGKALFDGPDLKVHLRFVEHDGAIYVDLADKDRNIVRIDSRGWEIVHNPPIRFRRPKAFKALPVPVRGGSLTLVRQFINIENDHDFILMCSWLVAAFRPGWPYPILAFNSEQGSGKSTASRMLRMLVDPNEALIRCEPREPRDLLIAANNGWVVALDNLSDISNWRSDALCRLSTGGGFSTRTLYENDEECIFNAMRPVIINGIEELGTRSDLLDRVIRISLPTIPEDKRRPEDELYAAFDKARPLILGAICDAVSTGLSRLTEVKLSTLPRMADFAKFIVAAEPALPWTDGEFMRAYSENRAGAHELAMEASAVGDMVLRFAATTGSWSGTASELLSQLDDIADDATRHAKGWPKRPHILSGQLRRIAPNLRQLGLQLNFGDRTSKKRIISMSNVAQTSVTSVTERHNHVFDSANAVLNDALTPEGDALMTHAASHESRKTEDDGRCDADDARDAEFQAYSLRFEDLIEEARERAAIMEIDGGLTREDAERRNGLHLLNGKAAVGD